MHMQCYPKEEIKKMQIHLYPKILRFIKTEVIVKEKSEINILHISKRHTNMNFTFEDLACLLTNPFFYQPLINIFNC